MPVIARDAFAAPDFIIEGENGLLLRKDDPEELALLMERCMTDAHMKEYVLSHMEQYRKEYSWDNIAEKMIDIISKDDYYG